MLQDSLVVVVVAAEIAAAEIKTGGTAIPETKTVKF